MQQVQSFSASFYTLGAALLNVDANGMPVQRGRWRRYAKAEHGAPASDVELGGQAAHGKRRELSKELMPRRSSGRVQPDTGYKRAVAHTNAPAPAAVPAHVVHAKKISFA